MSRLKDECTSIPSMLKIHEVSKVFTSHEKRHEKVNFLEKYLVEDTLPAVTSMLTFR